MDRRPLRSPFSFVPDSPPRSQDPCDFIRMLVPRRSEPSGRSSSIRIHGAAAFTRRRARSISTRVVRQPISITRPRATWSISNQSPMRNGPSTPSATPESASATTFLMAKPSIARIRLEPNSAPSSPWPNRSAPEAISAAANSSAAIRSSTRRGKARPWRFCRSTTRPKRRLESHAADRKPRTAPADATCSPV